MNKQTIITILFALVAMTGLGQIHYRLEGNIGHPEFTGIMNVRDVLKQQNICTIEVVNGIITPREGDLPEMAMCVLADTTNVLVQTDTEPYKDSKLTLAMLFVDHGTTRVEGLKDNWLQQSGTSISEEIANCNQRMADILEEFAETPNEGKSVMAELIYDVISRHTKDVYGINLLVNEGRWYLDATKWIELYDKLMHDNGEYIRHSGVYNYTTTFAVGGKVTIAASGKDYDDIDRSYTWTLDKKGLLTKADKEGDISTFTYLWKGKYVKQRLETLKHYDGTVDKYRIDYKYGKRKASASRYYKYINNDPRTLVGNNW